MSEISANCILIRSVCREYSDCGSYLRSLIAELSCEASQIGGMGKDFAPIAKALDQMTDNLRNSIRKMNQMTDALYDILEVYEGRERRLSNNERHISRSFVSVERIRAVHLAENAVQYAATAGVKATATAMNATARRNDEAGALNSAQISTAASEKASAIPREKPCLDKIPVIKKGPEDIQIDIRERHRGKFRGLYQFDTQDK